jgi:predicted nucleic acid-binding protein
MQTICALIDINIIIDDMAKREPFVKLSHDILALCAQNKFIGYISAHTIPTAHYILRKQYSTIEVKNMLRYICEIFNIAGYTKEQVVNAPNNDDFSDFEDCLQMESAKTANADYIITRVTIQPEYLKKQQNLVMYLEIQGSWLHWLSCSV